VSCKRNSFVLCYMWHISLHSCVCDGYKAAFLAINFLFSCSISCDPKEEEEEAMNSADEELMREMDEAYHVQQPLANAPPVPRTGEFPLILFVLLVIYCLREFSMLVSIILNLSPKPICLSSICLHFLCLLVQTTV